MRKAITNIKAIFVLGMVLFMASCTVISRPNIIDSAPDTFKLLYPEDDTQCNTGIIDQEDEAFSTVNFQWEAVEEAASYRLQLTVNDGESAIDTVATGTDIDLRILRGAPFKWQMTALSSVDVELSKSEVFEFYNEGPGVESYAPFSSKVVAPENRSEHSDIETIDLEWETTDLDDDIKNYEVYIGTKEDSIEFLGEVVESEWPDYAVEAGNTYFWYVIAEDDRSNQSISQIFSFTVE